jgi:hypothetical protein
LAALGNSLGNNVQVSTKGAPAAPGGGETGQMPRDDAIIFSDLIGKLDMLRVACDKCGRDGCYGLGRLIEKRGRDAEFEVISS